MKLVQSKPALKARDLLALHEIAAGGNVKDAMIKAGFKPTTANNSTKLKKKKSWIELMDRFLPDSLLSKVHNEGLNATQFIPQGIGKGETELIEVPDHSVRHKYLKTAYDLKGRIKQTETASGTTSNTLIVITTPQEETITAPHAIDHVEINDAK
jgi:hypothetical protein